MIRCYMVVVLMVCSGCMNLKTILNYNKTAPTTQTCPINKPCPTSGDVELADKFASPDDKVLKLVEKAKNMEGTSGIIIYTDKTIPEDAVVVQADKELLCIRLGIKHPLASTFSDEFFMGVKMKSGTAVEETTRTP